MTTFGRWLLLRYFACMMIVCVLATRVAYGEEAAAPAAGGGTKSYAIPWLVILLVVALGLFITLRPAGRAGEIKRDPREL